MLLSKATVRVQLVHLMNVETRRLLDQVQNPQHITILLSEISLNLFWETFCFIQANSAWPSLCRLVDCQL